MHICKVLATELSGQGVMVNAIAPGPIETGLSHHGATRKKAYTDRIPVGAYGTVDAVANAAVTRAILGGRVQDARRDVVALCAGAALYLAGRAPDLRAGVAEALEVLQSGAGLETLERYAAFTQAG